MIMHRRIFAVVALLFIAGAASLSAQAAAAVSQEDIRSALPERVGAVRLQDTRELASNAGLPALEASYIAASGPVTVSVIFDRFPAVQLQEVTGYMAQARAVQIMYQKHNAFWINLPEEKAREFLIQLEGDVTVWVSLKAGTGSLEAVYAIADKIDYSQLQTLAAGL